MKIKLELHELTQPPFFIMTYIWMTIGLQNYGSVAAQIIMQILTTVFYCKTNQKQKN